MVINVGEVDLSHGTHIANGYLSTTLNSSRSLQIVSAKTINEGFDWREGAFANSQVSRHDMYYMAIRDRTKVRRWRIRTVLDSLNARFYVYIPFELENPVMVLLYYSKSFIHDCDIELSKSKILTYSLSRGRTEVKTRLQE